MRLQAKVIAAVAVAFLLVPALRANDDADPAAGAKNDNTVGSRVALGALAEARPAPPAASLPATPPQPAGGGQAYLYVPRVELFMGYSYIRNIRDTAGNRIEWMHGGSASLALNFDRYVGMVFDFGGSHADTFGPLGPPNGGVVNASGNVFTYLFGPRLSFRHERVTPFVQTLFGVVHATPVTVSIARESVACLSVPKIALR